MIGGTIPVTGYEPPGTPELGEAAANAMGNDRDAVLLENHGGVAVGETVSKALEIARTVGYCTRIQYQARSIGEPNILDDDTISDLRTMFTEDYG